MSGQEIKNLLGQGSLVFVRTREFWISEDKGIEYLSGQDSSEFLRTKGIEYLLGQGSSEIVKTREFSICKVKEIKNFWPFVRLF